MIADDTVRQVLRRSSDFFAKSLNTDICLEHSAGGRIVGIALVSWVRSFDLLIG